MPKKLIKNKERKRTLRYKNTTKILFFTVILLLASLILVYQTRQSQNLHSSAQTLNNCSISDTELAIDSEEQKMLDLINTYRQQNGAGPLKFSPSLNQSAAWLSSDMNAKKYLSHTDSLKRSFAQRSKDCGIAGGGGGENIASTGTSADKTINAWKKSPGHNANMLNKNWKTIGIARSGKYWTQDFSSTDDSGSGIIPVISTNIPSPACLGSCLTPTAAAPIPTQSTQQQPTSVPGNTVNPSENPQPEEIAEPIIENQASKGETKGLPELILEFLKKLIELLLALFGIK